MAVVPIEVVSAAVAGGVGVDKVKITDADLIVPALGVIDDASTYISGHQLVGDEGAGKVVAGRPEVDIESADVVPSPEQVAAAAPGLHLDVAIQRTQRLSVELHSQIQAYYDSVSDESVSAQSEEKPISTVDEKDTSTLNQYTGELNPTENAQLRQVNQISALLDNVERVEKRLAVRFTNICHTQVRLMVVLFSDSKPSNPCPLVVGTFCLTDSDLCSRIFNVCKRT